MQDGGAARLSVSIVPTVLPQVEAERVKVLASLTAKRASVLPDVSSAQELGVDIDPNVWLVFLLPKGTPPAIVRKLHNAAAAAMEPPAVAMRLHEVGADLVAPERRSADYLQRFVGSEIEKWAVPIRASGVWIE